MVCSSCLLQLYFMLGPHQRECLLLYIHCSLQLKKHPLSITPSWICAVAWWTGSVAKESRLLWMTKMVPGGSQQAGADRILPSSWSARKHSSYDREHFCWSKAFQTFLLGRQYWKRVSQTKWLMHLEGAVVSLVPRDSSVDFPSFLSLVCCLIYLDLPP